VFVRVRVRESERERERERERGCRNDGLLVVRLEKGKGVSNEFFSVLFLLPFDSIGASNLFRIAINDKFVHFNNRFVLKLYVTPKIT